MPLVRIERNSFERILNNILSNAIKYSYHGITLDDGERRQRAIRIWCRPRHDLEGRMCMIAIQNYGIGIEAYETARVLEPGYRGRLAKREVQIGTGLGLSEAVKILKIHGGYLSFRSRVVHGETYLTTVRIILPALRRMEKEHQDGQQ